MSAKYLLKNYTNFKNNYQNLMQQLLNNNGVINRQYPSCTQKYTEEMPNFHTNVITSTTENYAIRNVTEDEKAVLRLNELNRIINAIEKSVSSLPEKERKIIKWKYFENKDLNKLTLFNRHNEVMTEKGIYFLHNKALESLDISLKFIKLIDY